MFSEPDQRLMKFSFALGASIPAHFSPVAAPGRFQNYVVRTLGSGRRSNHESVAQPNAEAARRKTDELIAVVAAPGVVTKARQPDGFRERDD